MSVEAISIPARTPPRARATFQHVLKAMLRLDFKRMVIERTVEVIAGARKMVCVAGLLLMEACVVGEPFFRGRRANVSIQAMNILVEGDKSWWNGSWEIR